MPETTPTLTAEQRVELALTLGKALAQATVIEAGDEYVDWSEWHRCPGCPTGGPCACSGTAYAKPELIDALAPIIARMVADAEQRGVDFAYEAGRELGREEGRAEVSVAVEAVLSHPYPDVALDAFTDDQQAAVAIASAALRKAMKGDIRAILANGIGASDV